LKRPPELPARQTPAPVQVFCEKAVEITLDIEQPLYEATTLLNAVSLINRIAKES